MNAQAPHLPRIVSLTEEEKTALRLTGLERIVDALLVEQKAMRAAMEDTITGAIAVPAYAKGVRGIVDEMAIKHGFLATEIIGRKGGKWLSHARQEVMCIAHEAGFSLPLIGRVLGGRDHTTILHGVRAHRARGA